MLNDIQITSDYMSRWVVLKRRVGTVTSLRVLKDSKIVLIVDLSLYLKTTKLLSVFPLFMRNMLSFLILSVYILMSFDFPKRLVAYVDVT
jgi:hypothetical protein